MAISFFRKKPDLFDDHQERTCKNCGHVFQGRFCSQCGEKVIDRTDRAFGKLAESILNALTFMDGKFWRSFKLILSHPGKLSAQIRAGIQVPYMRLIGLFFVANFFYFLFPVFNTFHSPLYSQYHQQNYSSIVQELVSEEVKGNNIDIDVFTKQYNAHSTNLAKLLLILLVFIFTLPLAVVNYSKKNFYFDHLQISFEFHAFQLLIFSVILPNLFKWIIKLADQWAGADWSVLMTDNVFSDISMLFFMYFWIRAQRNFYQHAWWISVLKGLFLGYIVFYSWQVYRMILFFVTFYTM
jgi:Protein of unknown function (DUF3667)